MSVKDPATRDSSIRYQIMSGSPVFHRTGSRSRRAKKMSSADVRVTTISGMVRAAPISRS